MGRFRRRSSPVLKMIICVLETIVCAGKPIVSVQNPRVNELEIDESVTKPIVIAVHACVLKGEIRGGHDSENLRDRFLITTGSGWFICAPQV